MTIGFAALRRGVTIELDGNPYIVLEYERQKMQQRAPVVRLKLRNLRTSQVLERTFQAYTVEFPLAEVITRVVQYLYFDGQSYTFMDTEDFEQYQLSREHLGEAILYLKEGINLSLMFYNEEPISVELPTTVDLQVTESPPGLKGDTAQGGTKPATLETGLVLQVPLFVMTGGVVRVDTRTGQYVARV